MLAAIMAITPLTIDMYLPAMSTIAASFHASVTDVQQSLSIYLAGYAMGMLTFGPLADRVGRRPLVIIGLSGFMLTTLGLALTEELSVFLVLRFVQAFLGSAATVVIPGYVKEIYGDNTAKGMSYVGLIMLIAPLAAPTIGSVILGLGNWRLIFYVLTLYSLLLLLLVTLKLRMPSDKATSERSHQSMLRNYAVVFSRPGVKPYLCSCLLCSLAFFSYLTASPFVYMEVFGLSDHTFALLFALNVGALAIANLVNSRIVVKHGSRKMLALATATATVAAFALLLVNYFTLPYWYTVIVLVPLLGSMGIMSVNSDAIVLMKFKQETGTATAVIGTLRFGVGALAGPILALFYTGTAMPFCALMAAAVVLVGICQLFTFPGTFVRQAS
ncbi:multidrug effflux MFS transporter [Shewanella avicenniae]|uniref:Bcr/CflA family efflux transporter n=2 Tax=Shewanella avicenniae TaxID=2814294 RepID=A0ABX7QW36_9GAMM|nr:multidrug effflux MFS transporter [Shewanella avicenniae]QSX35479.1 multidrug effflux MFS transporter [Shewanella avicenniae]